jgi:hypothetical protein
MKPFFAIMIAENGKGRLKQENGMFIGYAGSWMIFQRNT